ncbi:MAG TPA: hypothetical protein DCY20_09460 [Firmicutes bacterium]|nr:hypothetical protein [Bacillota bacterium]
MDKITNTIAYIIVLFTLFNFFYGFSNHIQGFAMWHWYLIILSVTIGVLLFIKVKRMKLEQELANVTSKHEAIRLRFQQKDDLQKLYQCTEEQFAKLVCDLYTLEGIEDVEVCEDVDTSGYNLIYWHEGNKTVVKWFKHRPIPLNDFDVDDLLTTEGDVVTLSQVREFLGVARDYDIQADDAVILTTTNYADDVLEYAKRNNVTLINGEVLMQRMKRHHLNQNN